MVVRFYSSIAQETTLTASITNSATSMTVAAVTGFPSSTPYTLAIDYNTPSEELVQVNGTSGTTLSPIIRGVDGTSAIAHNSGAKVRHVSSGRDFADSRSHENATTDVHGIGPGAAIVSTTASQIISNKTLVAPTTINGATFDNITTGAWTTYVPVWASASNPQPIVGPATLSGKYSKIGRLVRLRISLGGASATNYGNGEWTFTLPFTAATQPTGLIVSTGTGICSGLAPVPLTSFISSTDTTKVRAWGIQINPSLTISAMDQNFMGVGFNSLCLDITYESTT